MTKIDHAERILEDLHHAQDLTRELAHALEHDLPAQDQPHFLRAWSLLSRLYALESDLLASPPSPE